MTLKKVLSLSLIILLLFPTASGLSTYQYKVKPMGESDIARLTMCADDCKEECKNLLLSFGHAFFVLENISKNSITLNGCTILPNEFVTFSWWAVDKHMGVWFNIESNYINIGNRYKNVVGISTYLDSDEFDKLNSFVTENDYYTPISNCSKQVMRCWNTVADETEKISTYSVATPEKLKEQILSFEESQKPKIAHNTDIFYFNGSKSVKYSMKVGK